MKLPRFTKFAVAVATPPRYSTLAATANPPTDIALAHCPACHRTAPVFRRSGGRLVCSSCADLDEAITRMVDDYLDEEMHPI